MSFTEQTSPIWQVDVLSYTTKFSKIEGENTKLFYGVELEVEPISDTIFNRREIAQACLDDIGEYVNIREDDSVPSGFEIVTVPCSLNFHKEVLWKDFFNKSGSALKASDRTGLHIHFSREALTDKQLAKCIYFVHETTNSGFLSKIAGRRVWAEARWTKQRKKSYAAGYESAIIDSERGARGALSVSGHYSGTTCEMRIFKSNPSKQGVLQALEFVDALIKYCGECPDNEKYLHYKEFVSWFDGTNQKDKYPYFSDNLLL